MNKKIVKIISSHHSFLRFCLSIFNHFNIKNKLLVKGCQISIGVSFVNGLKIISTGKNNEVIIGDYVRIKDSTIIIHGNNNKILIMEHARLNQVEFCMEDSYNEISIGKSTNFCGKTHLAAIEGTKIIIGSDCLFSSDLHFRTGDSHSILNLQGERINVSQNIVIEDHVWIGTKVTCLKGVHVSKNSIVAATTTLCKIYNEENVIIGGVPGKIIKKDITWTHKRV